MVLEISAHESEPAEPAESRSILRAFTIVTIRSRTGIKCVSYVQLMRTPACSVCSVVAEMGQITRTTEACGAKGTARPLSQRESTPTLAFTGFYCFSGHITWRMVLIDYAQVCFRCLPSTENKGEDVANDVKKEGYLQM